MWRYPAAKPSQVRREVGDMCLYVLGGVRFVVACFTMYPWAFDWHSLAAAACAQDSTVSAWFSGRIVSPAAAAVTDGFGLAVRMGIQSCKVIV